jgi:GNAT superfamily N-acetyltransferase
MHQSAHKPKVNLADCTENDSRWPEFLECLRQIAPEQEPFVVGDYSRNLSCHLTVAVVADRVVGFLRFGVQEIRPEVGCPALMASDGRSYTEAKIHAFAVRSEYRRQGIGTALQKRAIERSRAVGCHQLVSHTSLDNVANVSLKLALGFAAQPESHDDEGSVLFYMPLQVDERP